MSASFRQRLAEVEHAHAHIERDAWFWVEHVAHWNVLLLAVIGLMSFAYVFLNSHGSAFASGQ